jgi:hypothetical protein
MLNLKATQVKGHRQEMKDKEVIDMSLTTVQEQSILCGGSIRQHV